jgi:chloramphenicol O-acetyltransferase
MKRNVIKEKSFSFALDVIYVYKKVIFEKKEFVMSK